MSGLRCGAVLCLVACGGGSGEMDAAITDGAPIVDAVSSDSSIDADLSGCSEVVIGTTTCDGTYIINNVDDVTAIEGCAIITGNLTVTAQGLTEVVLPNLERVDGELVVSDSTTLERLALPGLRQVVGQLLVYTVPALRDVDLRSLVTGSDINIGVAAQSLPCLSSTTGSLFVS